MDAKRLMHIPVPPTEVAGELPGECSNLFHCMPLNDLRPHIGIGRLCWCRPDFDESTGLIRHHSLDRREDYESGRLRPH